MQGRPSKVTDPEFIRSVTETVLANSQDSSIWLPAEGRHQRVLQSSLFSMWLGCGYTKKLKWSQWYRIFMDNCHAWAKPAQRKTDMCDHCVYWHSSLEPGLKKFLNDARASLCQFLPSYFDALCSGDSEPILERAKAWVVYIDKHAEKNRSMRAKAVKGAAAIDLHSLEARILHELRWELRVAESYVWHKQTAERQTSAVFQQRTKLPLRHCLIWTDWKQNLTIPLATVQTANMFYGPSRQEVSCIAFVIYEGAANGVRQRNVVFLTEIIEHTSLASSIFFEETKKFLRGPGLRPLQSLNPKL